MRKKTQLFFTKMPMIKLHFIYYAGFCSVNKNYLDNFYVPTLNTKFDSSKILPLGWAQFFSPNFFKTVLNKFANRSRCASMNKVCLSASITGRYGATLITFFISFLHKIFESTFQRGGAGVNKLGWAPP